MLALSFFKKSIIFHNLLSKQFTFVQDITIFFYEFMLKFKCFDVISLFAGLITSFFMEVDLL